MLDEDARHKRATSPLQVFDVKNPAVRAALEDAPKIGESLCDDVPRALRRRARALDAYGVPYVLDPTLVRGLDYYTRTTFEFIGPDENANSTICGGGRYDGLVEAIGGPPTPGIGFGAGLERLLLALENEGFSAVAGAARRVLRASARERPRDASCRCSPNCAARGVSADIDYAGRSLKGQLTQAGRTGARAVVIVARRRRRRSGGRAVDEDGRARRGRRYAHRSMSWRDLYCGDTASRPTIGERVTVAGWVDTRRDHGGLVFVDLRDHTGEAPARDQPGAGAGRGGGRSRDPQRVRPAGRGGGRRARARGGQPEPADRARSRCRSTALEILSRSTPLPFQLDEENVDETLRLRYRWLDMRRERMQHNLRLSHTVIAAIRRTMDDLGFIDVWTPSMTRGTPEGARDFLVPVRLQPGKFFALAQSPQLFKQLCMVGGIDRYYQIATCWRDEDLRADRQFEFRQLDLELAFAEREDVLDVMEAAVVASFDALGREAPPRPFERLAYDEVMARFGTDKPDLRFGMEIQDATEVTRGSEFGVFAGAGVRSLPRRAEGVLARRARPARGDRQGVGGEGPRVHRRRRERRGALADRQVPLRARAGRLRRAARLDRALRGRRRGCGRPRARRPPRASRTRARSDRAPGDVFHWMLDFPLFERDEDRRVDVPAPPLHRADAGGRGVGRDESERVRGQHYDLVWNGWELGSGSIRIHDVEVQQQVFRTMGLSAEEATVEVRLPARSAGDGRTAARRVRDGHRALRRPDRGRAGHPPGDRVPEGLERLPTR